MPDIASLLLSAALAATPTTPTPWFQSEDYPVRAFQRRQQGTTAFEVVISPDGRPTDCRIVMSSGHSMLDSKACTVAMKRVRFTPAADDNGRPAYGVYRTQVRWALDPVNWAQSEVGPDLELSLSKLPEGAKAPLSVKYAVTVDASGKLTGCAPISELKAASLAELGCAKLKSDLRRTPAASGVESIQTAWITFSN